jgi:hypothetical protein
MCFHIVNSNDIWMVELSCSLHFLLKTPQSFSVGGKRRRQDFYGNVAVDLWIMGQVNLTHSTSSKLGTDFVPVEFCPWLQRLEGLLIGWYMERS